MQEVLRLKKIEEKKEIDEQIKQGNLLVGSPGSKRDNYINELSEINYAISGALSVRNGQTVLSAYTYNKGSSGKIKAEDIEKLDKKCQRMIFEKEEQYIENEQKLKREDDELADLEM